MPRRKGKRSKADEVYHVEVITKTRVPFPESDGEIPSWEYYVKWAGYDSDANSWEPEANLESCQRLLRSFWEHIGVDDNDYVPGTELSAKPEWIAKEKQFFAEEYKAAQREATEKSKASKKGKRKSASAEPHSKRVVPSDDESSADPAESLKITIPGIGNRKRKTVLSSSSEDEPLATTMRSKSQSPKALQQPSNEPIEVLSSPKSPSSLFSEGEAEVSSPDLALQKAVPVPKKPPPKGIKMPRRSTNPQANLATMSPAEIAVKGGISTKQRIAQGALAPALPREIAASTKNQSKSNTKKSVLGELSFKKRKIDDAPKSVTGGASVPINKEPTLSSLNSPLIQSPSTSFIGASASSTQPPLQQFMNARPHAPAATVSPAMVFPAQPPMQEVDHFLESIMPHELAAPLVPAPSPGVEALIPKSLHPVKVPLPTRVLKDKTWKWTGPMYVDSAEKPLCDVHIHNTTIEPALRFSMMFDNTEKLDLSALYTIADVRSMLSVFRPPTQIAQLSPVEENRQFTSMRQYLKTSRKLFLVPMRLDNHDIGQIFCFPLELHASLGIDIPVAMNLREGDMVMAILPYTLDVEELSKDPWVNPVDRTRYPLAIDKTIKINAGQLRTYPPYYHLASSMLNFSPKLLEYVAHPVHKRPYTIWWGKETQQKHNEQKDLETKVLETLLDCAKAVRASSRSSTRIIFIHLGALRSVHYFPDFVERRAKEHQIQFYLYGSDASVHPDLWGVHEVWPCGGIATFSANAMAKDPQGVCHLIMRIHKHPLWACYILPSALGMLASIECGTEVPVEAFDKRTLRMDGILQLIADGEVALLEAPPEQPTFDPEADVRAEWLAENIALLPPTRRSALERGIVAYRVLQAQQRAMEDELAENMARMHRHPAFMFSRRRYVVVCAEGEDEPRPNTVASTFEWCTLAKFDFKDEYYPKQSVGTK